MKIEEIIKMPYTYEKITVSDNNDLVVLNKFLRQRGINSSLESDDISQYVSINYSDKPNLIVRDGFTIYLNGSVVESIESPISIDVDN
jgi:hypothetical protein